MLAKENRLKNSKDFQDTYTKGRFSSSKQLTLRFAKNKNPNVSSFGFAVGKKYDKTAVGRNRAKRILRSAIFSLKQDIVPGFYLIICINKPTIEKKISVVEITSELKDLLKKCNLLK